MNYNLIIWDWNGTIIDDFNAAFLSVNQILKKRKMSVITKEQYYSYIDTPITKFYENLFDLNKVNFNELAEEFSKGYHKFLPKNPINKITRDTLKFLKKEKINQVLLSASNVNTVNQLITQYKLDSFFDYVSGANNNKAESKVDRGKRIVNGFNVPLKKTIAIGDCIHDSDLAKEIGIDCILYSGGHQSKKDLLKQNVPVVDNISDIISYIIN